MAGWIKLHRKVLDSPVFNNPHLFRMWTWCLLKASHKSYKQIIGLEEKELKEGQFITGRIKGSRELNINESTWYKHLKTLERMGMLELESNNKMTIVTIVNWRVYQEGEEEKEQQNNNRITTKEQQNNTNKNVKNYKELYISIVEYLNEKTGKNFSNKAKSTTAKINARLEEGFTLEDFKKVIDIKSSEWLNDANMQKYLRPETLFGTKFEGYLNDKSSDSNVLEFNPNWRGSDKRL